MKTLKLFIKHFWEPILWIATIWIVFSLISCTTYKIKFPEPVIPERPNITFRNCLYNNQEKPEICLSILDTKELIKYILLLEENLLMCSETVKEINK